MRRFERNIPHQQSFVQGRSADRNAQLTQSVRANRTVQPGNAFERQIRVAGPLAPYPDVQIDSEAFSFDPDHPVVTYYYTPSERNANPTRDPAPGSTDNFWSESDTGKVPLIPVQNLADLPPVATVIPSIDFSETAGNPAWGDYVLNCKIELLDADNVTVQSFEMTGRVSGDELGGVGSFDNDGINFGTDTQTRQFYGVKLTWTVEANTLADTGPYAGMATVNLTWLTAVPLQFGIKNNWLTEYWVVPGIADNVINITDEDFRTGIVWVDPDHHGTKFPWHYEQPHRFRGSPVFWLNWLHFSQTFPEPGPFAIFFKPFKIVTVDKDGADVDELVCNDLYSFLGGMIGFHGYVGDQQADEACGFYFKFEQQIYGIGVIPDESTVLSLLKPLRIWWRLEDVPAP